MRVTFYNDIKTKSGKSKASKTVFMSVKNDSICFQRTYVRPRITDQNRAQGAKMKAAMLLWTMVHSAFRHDLFTYANAYNTQRLPDRKRPINALNVYLMAVLKHSSPFTVVSGVNGIVSVMGPTVSEWMESGFLPNVSNANFLDADIVTG